MENLLHTRRPPLAIRHPKQGRLPLLCLLLLLATLGGGPLYAQQRNISGRVTGDKGEALPGVTILVKGTTTGTATDGNGDFSFSVPAGSGTLVVSFIGYLTQEVSINNRSTVNISLAADAKNLEEVVVVGYGTQKREQVTSAVASVKSEDFIKGSVNDAAQLIQGKVAGLSVVRPDADPTGTSQINLRGIATLKTSTAPLVLIDGVPGTLTTVAPEDIESVDILKDGSAAAIYGTRGTNGVILITTRKVNGETPPTVEVNAYFTTQTIIRKLDFMDAAQYRSLVAQGKPGATDYGYDTNWLDQVLQTPFSQVYNVTLKGGSRNTNYIANVNYRDMAGIMKRSDNRTLFPRLSLNHNMFEG
jgi:TonB-dependent SusC/RagA subfamily outer membrane receptor